MSTLVKSNGFPTLRTMLEDFWPTDRFFDKAFLKGELLPAVNIRETENKFKLEVAAPGFKKDDFKITTDMGLLTISAETSSDKEEEKENYTRQEFSRTAFTRTFSLPENVLEDDINAHYSDGLLKIELKKSEKAPAKKKEIKVN